MKSATKTAVFQQLTDLAREVVPDDGFVTYEEPERLTFKTADPVTVNGREKDSMELLSVIIQKRHVGFYFMPVYLSETLKDSLPDDLDAMLKGKSCFHMKAELSDEQKARLADLIEQGVALYREKAWV
jgi:hypothetical protein